MDCSLPGSSLYGIIPVRILEWDVISSSRGSFPPRDQTCFPALTGGFFTTESSGKPVIIPNEQKPGLLFSCLYTRTRASLGGSDSEESVCNAGNLSWIPGLERSPGGRHSNPLQYSCQENPHGQRILGGYSLWGHKESDTTERPSTARVHTHTRTHAHNVTIPTPLGQCAFVPQGWGVVTRRTW